MVVRTPAMADVPLVTHYISWGWYSITEVCR